MPENPDSPLCLLVINRYPKWLGIGGFLSMAIFHFPLWLNKKIGFYKLMGTGKNGSFDIVPDFGQWAMLITANRQVASEWHTEKSSKQLIGKALGDFIARWLSFFGVDSMAYLLEPIAGHGTWDGKQPFGSLGRQPSIQASPIAVLTRATIRPSRLKAFWKNVEPVAGQMAVAPGFVTSVGIGEAPFVRQATFSVWTDAESMKNFAYQQALHKEVVRRTYKENWYSEEMFVRFRIINAWQVPAVETLLP